MELPGGDWGRRPTVGLTKKFRSRYPSHGLSLANLPPIAPLTPTPEQEARKAIDAAVAAAGWVVQERDQVKLRAGQGVAVREVPLAPGHGQADYLLYVDGRAVGALEAKAAGHTLSSVEVQVDRYGRGLPANLPAPVRPLPFLYVSTGTETRFINGLDPRPKTRAISINLPHIHRPETLAEWIAAESLAAWVRRFADDGAEGYTAAEAERPASLRARPQTPADLMRGTQYRNQIEAVTHLPASSRVVIATIQRVYSMMRGEAHRDPSLERDSRLGAAPRLQAES